MNKAYLRKLICEIVEESLPKRETLPPDILDLLEDLKQKMWKRGIPSAHQEAILASLSHSLLKGGWKKSLQQECDPCGCGDPTDNHVDELGGMVTGLKNQVHERKTAPLESEEIFSIHGIDGFDINVLTEFSIYHGTGAADDPTEVIINSIVSQNDFMEADLTNPTAEETKVIQAVKLGVKLLNPSVKEGILVPTGTDMILLNKKMRNYLQTDIHALQESLYEKYARYH
jgi:hypothetical protein